MIKKLFSLAVLAMVLIIVLVLPVMAFGQDPGVPQVPVGYETVYLILSALSGVLIVPLIQFLKAQAWYPKTNSSWLDWLFQALLSFMASAILALIYVKKFELNQIFLVTFIMVISTLTNTLRKTATK